MEKLKARLLAAAWRLFSLGLRLLANPVWPYLRVWHLVFAVEFLVAVALDVRVNTVIEKEHTPAHPKSLKLTFAKQLVDLTEADFSLKSLLLAFSGSYQP